MKRTTVYPAGRPDLYRRKVNVLVSISHWGIFDLAPIGIMIEYVGTIRINYGDGDGWHEKPCDTEAFMEAVRPVAS